MKNRRRPTVSIAIPALNEEIGLGSVLDQIVRQSQNKFRLVDVTVYSDGSTDRTIEVVKERQKVSKNIKLVNGKKRVGKLSRLNEIFRKTRSDFLITLDGDIYLNGVTFLDDLVDSIINDDGKVMVAAHQIMKKPDSFLGKIIHADFSMWDRVRLSFPDYDCVQNFYGAATIYRRDFARSLRLPKDLGDDERGFIYLSAINSGKFGYAKNASITYYPPATIFDQLRLHKRTFGRNLPRLAEIFGDKVYSAYAIPKSFKLKGLFFELVSNPFFGSLAVLENLALKFVREKTIKPTGLWDVLLSTKQPFKTVVFSNFDSLSNPNYFGGGAVACHEVAKRLAKTFKVVVLSGKFKGSSNKMIDGVFYKRIGTTFFGPKLGQPIFSALLIIYIYILNFDVWIESFVPPFSSFFLNVFSKSDIPAMIHMLPGKDMERKYGFPVVWWENLVIKARKSFIVTTNESRNEILKINKNAKILTIPNGIKIPERVSAKKRHILFIGRWEFDQKGFDLLLPAFQKSKARKRIPLVIAGNGMDEDKIVKTVEKLGIKEDVRIVGRVWGSQKEKLLAEAAAVIVPSKFETRSQTALEALAFGKPLVCFDIPGFKWVPHNVAIKVRPFDERKLTLGIDRAMNFSGKLGRKFAKQFDNNVIVERYKDFIYEQIH